MRDYIDALKHLSDKKNKVSSHFLVNKKGEIFKLVDTKYRAWHAGESMWKNITDINSSSIGIEVDNSGYILDFEEYNNDQINSLIYLLKHLKIKFKIEDGNILGHSDIAPYRKIDPGEKFPWTVLDKKQNSKTS